LVCEEKSIPKTSCELSEIRYQSSVNDLFKAVGCVRESTSCERYISAGCGYGRCLSFKTTCEQYMLNASFDLVNTDDEQGTWRIKWYSSCAKGVFCGLNGSVVHDIVLVTLQPGEKKTISTNVVYEPGDEQILSAEIADTPTKKTCTSVSVNKTVCVNVTKSRPVRVCETKTEVVEVCS